MRPVTGPVRGSPGARLTWKPECEIPSVKLTIPHVGKNSIAFRRGTITYMLRGRGNAHVQLLDRLQRARAAELLGHWPRRLSHREMSRTEAPTILVAASSGHQRTPGVSATFYDQRAPRAEVRSDNVNLARAQIKTTPGALSKRSRARARSEALPQICDHRPHQIPRLVLSPFGVPIQAGGLSPSGSEDPDRKSNGARAERAEGTASAST